MGVKWSRLFAATMIAPFGGCVLASTLAFLVAALVSKEADFFYFLIVPLFGFAYAVTTGLLASFVIGAPLHVVLSRLRLRSWLAYCLAGAAGGMIVYAASILLGVQTAPWLASYLLVSGAGMGATFWLIRRPDRDVAANPPTSAP